MGKRKTRPVKYVFLDVVGYTNRPVEAQCDITATLNRIVKNVVENRMAQSPLDTLPIWESSVICIPTGDGICIALLDTALPYDIHLIIAKDILGFVWRHNRNTQDDSRKFEVRIGVNQSEDNLVKDINGRENVTGSGINDARRIMDCADGSQVLVSRTVHDLVQPHDQYTDAFAAREAVFKHGRVVDIYQLVDEAVTGINVNLPSSLTSVVLPEPRLSKLAAYYFAHLIKNESFVLSALEDGISNSSWLEMLFWFLAMDTKRESERLPHDVHGFTVMPKEWPTTVEKQLKWFRDNIPHQVALHVSRVLGEHAVPKSIRHACLEDIAFQLVVNTAGKEKLKTDWPEIWDDFGLGGLSG